MDRHDHREALVVASHARSSAFAGLLDQTLALVSTPTPASLAALTMVNFVIENPGEIVDAGIISGQSAP